MPRRLLRPAHDGAAGPKACDSRGHELRGSASAWRCGPGTSPKATGTGRSAATAPPRGSQGSAHPRSPAPAPPDARRSIAAAGPAACGRSVQKQSIGVVIGSERDWHGEHSLFTTLNQIRAISGIPIQVMDSETWYKGALVVGSLETCGRDRFEVSLKRFRLLFRAAMNHKA